MHKSRLYLSSVLGILLTLVCLFAAGCRAKKKSNWYECESPGGHKTTCWGGDWTFDDGPAVVDLQQTLVYDEAMVAAAAPSGAQVGPVDGETFINYETPSPQSFGSGLDYNSAASVTLTNEMNDGRTWYAYTPNLPEPTYDQWKGGLDPSDIASDFGFVLRSFWGPLDTGCDRFDEYDVDLFVRANSSSVPVFYDTIPTSWGRSLRDLVALPVNQAPDSAFDALPDVRREKLLAYLDSAAQSAEWGQWQAAVDELSGKFRPRVDGSVGGDPSNDWVIDPGQQALILPDLDEFISALQDAVSECG